MTPEERRKRAEHVVKMARSGVIAEPAYDREEWRAQAERDELAAEQAPKAQPCVPAPRKGSARRTA